MAQIVDVYGNPIRAVARAADLAPGRPGEGVRPAPGQGADAGQAGSHPGRGQAGQPPGPGRTVHGHGGTRRPLVRRNEQAKAYLGLDWAVESVERLGGREADADYLHELLLDLEGLEDLLLDALDGIGHGYSCIELEWALQGREWMPLAFHHRPQSWFQLNPEDQNELRLRDNSPAGEALQPFGWIIHRPRARSGDVARSGLFRVLAWPYLFRHYATSDLRKCWENPYGLPIRLGEISARDRRRGKGNLAAGRYRPGPRCCRHGPNHGHRLPAGGAGQ
ncbi:phage portal protein family protein [Pseudomonas aeruginosa]|uniref:phage portal protein family protein n=1 Tax=Pseudomonas aeruginosa TaxID=287 RepID=UPI003AAE33FC